MRKAGIPNMGTYYCLNHLVGNKNKLFFWDLWPSILLNPVMHLVITFLSDSDGKKSPYNAGDSGSNPGLGRYPGKGNGNSNILAWRIPGREEPEGVAKSRTRVRY